MDWRLERAGGENTGPSVNQSSKCSSTHWGSELRTKTPAWSQWGGHMALGRRPLLGEGSRCLCLRGVEGSIGGQSLGLSANNRALQHEMLPIPPRMPQQPQKMIQLAERAEAPQGVTVRCILHLCASCFKLNTLSPTIHET